MRPGRNPPAQAPPGTLRQEGLRFLLVGISATLLSWLISFFLDLNHNFNPFTTWILAWIIAALFKFYFAGRFVFQSSLGKRKFLLYLLSEGFNMLWTAALGLFLFNRIVNLSLRLNFSPDQAAFHASLLKPALLTALSFPVSFFFLRLVFKNRIS